MNFIIKFKNKVVKMLFLLLSFFCINTYSQKTSISVTYMSYKKMDLKMDSIKYDKETITRVQEIFAKQFQHEYILEYNNNKSVYYKQDKLNVNGMSTFNDDKLYKDFKTKLYTHKKELLDKVFLIKDSIKTKDWIVTNETKTIGKFICQKAVYERKGIDSIIDVVAWFTKDIPISNGPGIYDGLPGIILQVEDDNYTILSTKIELSKNIKIKEPKGGKVISQNEFDLIFQKKKKEGLNRAKSFRGDIESSRN